MTTSYERETEQITLLRQLTANSLMSRAAMARMMIDTLHDINSECGYPTVINVQDYKNMYDREAIAKRVVSLYPTETWSVTPEVYEVEDPDPLKETAFERLWKSNSKKHQFPEMFMRLDEVAGIGHYGVMLIGIDDGLNLDQPVAGVEEWYQNRDKFAKEAQPVMEFMPTSKILYLMNFDESQAPIAAFCKNQNSPRFGLPEYYNITFTDPGAGSHSFGSMTTTGVIRRVHWTRVIHLADNCKTSNWCGVPRQKAVFNRLLDCRKILSGSAEMYWKGAFPGYSFEVDPQIAAEIDLDTEQIRQQFEAYTNSLQRYLALQGVTAKSLAVEIADPDLHLAVQLLAIAISLECPKRVFEGSEEGKLAADQDSQNWMKRIQRRQQGYATSHIIMAVAHRLMAMGVLPTIAEVFAHWPDLHTASNLDKANVSAQLTTAIVQYVQAGADSLIGPLEFLTTLLGMEPDEAQDILDAAERRIMSRDDDEAEAA